MATSLELSEVNIGKTINYRFKIVRFIEKTASSYVFEGQDVITGRSVAVKYERPLFFNRPLLLEESNKLKILQGGVGIPDYFWSGNFEKDFVVVMELLGHSLQYYLDLCSGKFSVRTVLLLANQLITRFEYTHCKGLIHGDVKPNNFAMGTGSKDEMVYLIDFGLSEAFLDSSGNHVPFRDSIRRRPKVFSSLNADRGLVQTRRDDLESLGYCFVYFLHGDLPWSKVKLSAEPKSVLHELRMRKKAEVTVQQLCSGLPEEFATYLIYCRGLMFDECPDYSYLRKLFMDLTRKLNFDYDFKNYDWLTKATE